MPSGVHQLHHECITTKQSAVFYTSKIWETRILKNTNHELPNSYLYIVENVTFRNDTYS